MKKLVEDVENEGLLKLIGERVTFFCSNYIYTGRFIGVNDACVMLSDGGIVYETGTFSDSQWKDYQRLPNDFYVMLNAIESFGIIK